MTIAAEPEAALHDNPLFTYQDAIPFDRIAPGHVVPAVRAALARAGEELAAIVALSEPRTYENTLRALEEVSERLGRVTKPVAHLSSVMDTPDLRQAWQTVVPEISAFNARMALNPALWSAVKEYAETPDARGLEGVRARHLEKVVLAFRRAGADLPPERKARVEALRVELSQLSQEYANHVLDATNAWELVLTDEDDLQGLPESARAQARAAAAARGVDGWRFTLQLPSYQAFMQYAARRDLRRRMYDAYMNRAAGDPHDNRPVLRRMLEVRRELAGILGFRDWADYTLEDSMAGSGARAVAFEREMVERTRPVWRRQMAELEEFARAELGLDEVAPWDVAYAAERMRRARFDLDAEELRPYFPLDRVLEGLFEVARRLFGVRVQPRPVDEVWHADVGFYDVFDEEGGRLGGFYTDWYPREEKRGGAWMSGLVVGGPRPGGWKPHLAVVAANLSPPEGGRPALLTHREVQTVFHEFGHLLHHVLSRVEVPALGGTCVATDWVELPSQIMENWTWERPALDLFARFPVPGAHYQMRQLSFGTMDLELHVHFDPSSGEDPLERAQRVMEGFSTRPEYAHDHFVASFAHIFSGGYAAAYYSYLWSEVLDADAFSRFEREGLFSREVGRHFVEHVLSQGDAADPADLFRRFMGRDPDPAALLRRNLGVEQT